jgi:hypothetical protein
MTDLLSERVNIGQPVIIRTEDHTVTRPVTAQVPYTAEIIPAHGDPVAELDQAG